MSKENPLNIVAVNSRFFLSGGPERYLFNFIDLFTQKNHRVIPFSLRYQQNQPSPYSNYFVKPLGREDQIYFRDLSLNLKTILRLMSRSLYSFEVKKTLSKLIQKEKVKLVYLLQHSGTLSPSIIHASKKLGVPVVLRSSDFFLMCLNGLFLKKGQVCEACLQKSLWQGVKDSCVRDSFSLSLFRALTLSFHRFLKIYDRVDAFAAPSLLMTQKLKELGIPSKKVHHLPTFLNATHIEPQYQSDPYILYFGRISFEKGIYTLAKAWQKLNRKSEKLIFVGGSHNGEDLRFKKWLETREIDNVEVRPFQDQTSLGGLISKACFTVVPSICYENMPHTLLESFAYGKPVIASNLGSIPEVVRDQIDGLLFEPGNRSDLAEKINTLLTHPQKRVEMGKNARRHLEEDFSPERHYENLMGIFASCL